MSYTLIIAEKPSAAKKIAEALDNSKPIKKGTNPAYFQVTHDKEDIMVCAAVGHLYTVDEKEKGAWKYPVYDIEWKEAAQVRKDAEYTNKYLSLIKKLAKDAKEIIIATDYDIEGETIGYNILRFACKKDDAKRMKFSTVTKPDLQKAFKNVEKTLNWGQAYAGTTRHFLDWMYGINISRALTISVKKSGQYKLLSSGRVQGPALKILVDKELEIQKFIPEPYWELHLQLAKSKQIIDAQHKEGKFSDEKKAKKIYEKCLKKDAILKKSEAKQFKQNPPTPFDLGSLQTEAHRCFGIAPKETLEHAQNLYSSGFTSYPRTSSQKLPKEIDIKKILEDLKKNKEYEELAKFVLEKTKLKPNEGDKTDPAHPAIYPTGIHPKALKEREKKIYDLIVKRFFSVFGEAAVRETVTYSFDCEKEEFIAKGTRTLKKNWHELYAPYVKLEENELPKVEEKESVKQKDLQLQAKETKPPKRYTASSIINELEKRGLGTKATRAEIVDNLFKRGYVNEKSIQATELGIKTVGVIEKYVPEMVDEALTRHFEEEVEKIYEKKVKPEKVIDEAKNHLDKLLNNFKSKEKEIGKSLIEAIRDTQEKENTIGLCPICKNNKLMIKKGPYGKFVGCSGYPECKTILKIPQKQVKPTNEYCEHDNYPLIEVKAKKGFSKLCLNPSCKTKLPENEDVKKELKELEKNIVEKECPKCGNPLTVRKSVYGAFLGCSKFPKCRHMEPIKDGPQKEDFKK